MDYIAILAGGSGKRLWPLSRESKPKQLQKIAGGMTLIQETFKRVETTVPVKNIFVSTVARYADEIKKQLPEIPHDNYIIEPVSRGTAPAFACVALHILLKDKNATIATISSDHVVRKPKVFVKTVGAAFKAVKENPDHLVCVGINPTKPETAYGYIKMGSQKGTVEGIPIFEVDKFVEKPDQKTAEKYLQSWNCLWNGCYFFFKAKEYLKWIKAFRPKMSQNITKIKKLIESPQNKERDKKIDDLYHAIETEQVDTAIAEQNEIKRLVIPADLEWSDVGSWNMLHDILSGGQESGIVARGNHIDIGSQDSLVYAGNKLVATLGLKDAIIVDTKDVLFVARKSKAQDVRKIIAKLQNEGKHHYL